MPNQTQKNAVVIDEPKGKLGVLLVGLGAVSTTFIAGVEAIKRGIAEPIGSLTQMGTIRLGKRTDNRVPLVRDFVPLASIDDLVFGAWDIFEEDAYEAALAALREDTQAWWADTLAGDPDELGEGEEPATADVEGLRRFLEGEVLPWFETRKKECTPPVMAALTT